MVDMIRGQRASSALGTLKFTTRHAARVIEKLLKSAVANAVQKEMGDVDDLVISEAYVNGGPTLKRIQPGPKGMAKPILKRSSHITLIVSALPSGKKRPQNKRRTSVSVPPEKVAAEFVVPVSPGAEAVDETKGV